MSTAEEESPDPEARDTADVSPASGEPVARGRAYLAPGVVVAGKYLIEATLGSGGMGIVMGAMHLALRERVALKVLRPEAARKPENVARFLREAQALARLKSEHVARVMDVGTLDSPDAHTPYLVMEYLTGKDLAEVLRERGPLPVAEVALYVAQACEAMAEAHSLGIVHRDLKPANLFLTTTSDGTPRIKIIDFGIAKDMGGRGLAAGDEKLTASTVLLGSPAYMSPEQVRAAGDVDPRSDVWSLGVIIHELCSGRAPFEAETPAALLSAIAADAPAALRRHRSDVPPGLEAVVLSCLEKDRARRMPSAEALAAALEPFTRDLEGEALTTDATPAPPPAAPSRRRSAYFVAGATGMAALAIFGLVLRARTTASSAPAATASIAAAPPAMESAASIPSPSVAPPIDPRVAPSANAKTESTKDNRATAPPRRHAATPAPRTTVDPAATTIAISTARPSVVEAPAPAAATAIPSGGDVEAATARRK